MKTKLHSNLKDVFLKPSKILSILLFIMSFQFVSAQSEIECSYSRITVELDATGTATVDPYDVIHENCFGGHENLTRVEMEKTVFTSSDIGVNIVYMIVEAISGAYVRAPVIVTVLGTEPFGIKSETIIDVTCLEMGSIDIELTIEDPSITYLWSNGETTQDISNLSAGDYTVTVSKPDEEPVTKTVTVNRNITPLEITLDSPKTNYTNVSCNGANDGSINSTITGGCEPYSYLWNTNETTPNLSNASAGTYALTIIDAKGATLNKTITLTEPEIIFSIVTLSTIDLKTCSLEDNTNLLYGYPKNNVHSVQLNAFTTGGNGIYTYAWEPAEKFNDPTIENPIFTKKRAPKKEIKTHELTLTITDNLGCSNTQTVFVNSLNVGVKKEQCTNTPRKVLICHKGRKTLTVNHNSVAAHLENGDCLGSCVEDDNLTAIVRNSEANLHTNDLSLMGIKVFPNPSNGEFEINSNGHEEIHLLLIDISGKILEQKSITGNNKKAYLGNKNLSKGTYFLRVTTTSETVIKKLIVN